MKHWTREDEIRLHAQYGKVNVDVDERGNIHISHDGPPIPEHEAKLATLEEVTRLALQRLLERPTRNT
jgi:hypothetical protein